MKQKLIFGAAAGAFIERRKSGLYVPRQKMSISSLWAMEHWRKDRLLNKQIAENVVPDEFINHALDVVLSGGTQITAWYLAVFSDDYTPLSTDTYASPGYTEADGYDETTRPQWDEAGVSSKEITNSASKATFTMDGTDASLYGCALVSDNTKADTAGGGILGPAAAFSSAVTGIIDDDVIKVYMTITGSDV